MEGTYFSALGRDFAKIWLWKRLKTSTGYKVLLLLNTGDTGKICLTTIRKYWLDRPVFFCIMYSTHTDLYEIFSNIFSDTRGHI